MFGNHPRMSRLESRKQLLIAESELNREQLAGEIAVLTAGVRTLTDSAKSFGSMASSAALLVAGLAAFRHSKSTPAGVSSTWLRKILRGAGMISTIWLAFRTGARGEKDK
jgi:hypothetical protein